MKKIIFSLMAIIAVTFASCTNTNSNVKNDIKEYKNQMVENISVKEINIDKDFYEYTDDLSFDIKNREWYIDNTTTALNEFSDFVERATYFEMFDNATHNKINKMHEELKVLVENNSYKIDSIDMRIEDTKAMTQIGTVYVAKYKGFNKFGKKDGFYSFGVFTYNKDGSIHQYEGKDYMELVLTAYPNAMEEAGKTLRQAFGA